MAETSGVFIYNEELYNLPARVMVLLPVAWNELPEAEVVLLGKILSAARLQLNGVQIVTTQQTSLHKLKVFSPLVIISFGVALTPQTEFYQVKTTDNIYIIQSDSLGVLDDVRKKNLWNALKELINNSTL